MEQGNEGISVIAQTTFFFLKRAAWCTKTPTMCEVRKGPDHKGSVVHSLTPANLQEVVSGA